MTRSLFGDILFTGTKSKRGKTCAWVFAKSLGWAQYFPAKNKSQSHEALLFLFQNDGVPTAFIVDGSKEQI